MIPNPDLDFWNSVPKIHFWANLGQKSQSCPFCLKNGTSGILEELIPILDIDFQNFNAKINFWANLDQKKKLDCPFCQKIDTHGILEAADSKPGVRFSKFRPQIPFLVKFGQKKSKLSVLPENWGTKYFENTDSYSGISFFNFEH